MKPCIECREPKGLDEFYAHPHTADGRASVCKECHKRRMRTRAEHRREERSAYEARRRQTPERRAQQAEAQRRMRERDPRRYRARLAVRRAVLRGDLVPVPCRCGERRVQAHHADYDRPLDVVWECFRCHRAEHGQVVVCDLDRAPHFYAGEVRMEAGP